MILAASLSGHLVLTCEACWCGKPLIGESLYVEMQGSLTELKAEVKNSIETHRGFYTAEANCRHLKGVSLEDQAAVPFWDAVHR